MWGWEPTETTTYEYDADGRLIRSTTRREPEFDVDQLAWLLASERLESSVNAYGIPMAEATDPDNEHEYVANSMPTVDFSEKALRDKQDAYYKAWPDANRNGHVWPAPRKREG